ncbi:MAG: hypothetical protein AAF316_03550, partial [Cyanobacteria bacterium P01_A01_bin.80]
LFLLVRVSPLNPPIMGDLKLHFSPSTPNTPNTPNLGGHGGRGHGGRGHGGRGWGAIHILNQQRPFAAIKIQKLGWEMQAKRLLLQTLEDIEVRASQPN